MPLGGNVENEADRAAPGGRSVSRKNYQKGGRGSNGAGASKICNHFAMPARGTILIMSEEVPEPYPEWTNAVHLTLAILVGVITAIWSLAVAFFADSYRSLVTGNLSPYAVGGLTTLFLARSRPGVGRRCTIAVAAPTVLLSAWLAEWFAPEANWRGVLICVALGAAYTCLCFAGAWFGTRRSKNAVT